MASMEDCSDRSFNVGEEVGIFIDLPGRPNGVNCLVTSPSGAEVRSWIDDVEDTCYEIKFVPHEQGTYLVNLSVDGKHIDGSPQSVFVQEGNTQILKVEATGKGLKASVVDEPSYFFIKAKDAGAGNLSLSIDGPAPVDMKCRQLEDGTYKITYLATLAGMYEVNVKFAGNHIKNSPFRVHVKAAYSASGLIHQLSIGSDASQCIADGLGLRRAMVGQISCFKVNVRSAGEGALLVAIGPVRPEKEVDIKYLYQYSCIVHYTLVEEGDYIMAVFWGDDHIPGSPFRVKAWQKFPEIVKTRDKILERGKRLSCVRDKVSMWNSLFDTLNKIDEYRWKSAHGRHSSSYGHGNNSRMIGYRSHQRH